MSTVYLTSEERHLLTLLAATEVAHQLGRSNPRQYELQTHGVIDTVLNRLASDDYPDTLREIANEPNQFSAINGPRGRGYEVYGSVENVPASRIPAGFEKMVNDHLDARAKGAPSSVGGSLNYANPFHSDEANLRWINKLDGPRFGAGQMVHYHGTAAGSRPIEATLSPVPLDGNQQRALEQYEQDVRRQHDQRLASVELPRTRPADGRVVVNTPISAYAPQQPTVPALDAITAATTDTVPLPRKDIRTGGNKAMGANLQQERAEQAALRDHTSRMAQVQKPRARPEYQREMPDVPRPRPNLDFSAPQPVELDRRPDDLRPRRDPRPLRASAQDGRALQQVEQALERRGRSPAVQAHLSAKANTQQGSASDRARGKTPNGTTANARNTSTPNNGSASDRARGQTPQGAGTYVMPGQSAGLVAPGNLNLDRRQVYNGPAGDFRTENSISIGTDRGEVLIPTVVNGRQLTERQAIEHFERTGQNLGTFRTPDAANRYAETLHQRQEQRYAPKSAPAVELTDNIVHNLQVQDAVRNGRALPPNPRSDPRRGAGAERLETPSPAVAAWLSGGRDNARITAEVKAANQNRASTQQASQPSTASKVSASDLVRGNTPPAARSQTVSDASFGAFGDLAQNRPVAVDQVAANRGARILREQQAQQPLTSNGKTSQANIAQQVTDQRTERTVQQNASQGTFSSGDPLRPGAGPTTRVVEAVPVSPGPSRLTSDQLADYARTYTLTSDRPGASNGPPKQIQPTSTQLAAMDNVSGVVRVPDRVVQVASTSPVISVPARDPIADQRAEQQAQRPKTITVPSASTIQAANLNPSSGTIRTAGGLAGTVQLPAGVRPEVNVPPAQTVQTTTRPNVQRIGGVDTVDTMPSFGDLGIFRQTGISSTDRPKQIADRLAPGPAVPDGFTAPNGGVDPLKIMSMTPVGGNADIASAYVQLPRTRPTTAVGAIDTMAPRQVTVPPANTVIPTAQTQRPNRNMTVALGSMGGPDLEAPVTVPTVPIRNAVRSTQPSASGSTLRPLFSNSPGRGIFGDIPDLGALIQRVAAGVVGAAPQAQRQVVVPPAVRFAPSVSTPGQQSVGWQAWTNPNYYVDIGGHQTAADRPGAQ